MTDPHPVAETLARAKLPGFTPGKRDLGALFAALADGDADEVRILERALARRPELSVDHALAALPAASPAFAARLCRLLGRLAAAGHAPAALVAGLIAQLAAPDPRARRHAAAALGKLRAPPPELEAELLACWQREADAPVKRALADALGKVGGAAARAALAGAASDDPNVARALSRARLGLAREAARTSPSAIDASRAPAAPLRVRLHGRIGLARLLAEEASAAGFPARPYGDAAIELELRGPLAALFAIRGFQAIGFPLAPERGEVAVAASRALASPAALAIAGAFSAPPHRYRLAFARGGHRRAAVYAIAERVAAAGPAWVNDPVAATWEARVDEQGGAVLVELVPRGLDDPRFSYRVAEVPAASQPALAAALGFLAVRHARRPATDVVWDPFVGSGLELIERARRGPYRILRGTDLSEAALAAARANLGAAGLAEVELVLGDALAERRPASLIVTNPPMGRRVARGNSSQLLDDFVAHAAIVLGRGGLLVWVTPQARRSRERALAVGLELVTGCPLDMGGFPAEVQVLRRR